MNILASSVRIAEHEMGARLVDSVAELLQSDLSFIVEVFLAVVIKAGGVAQGAIGWVKIE